MKILYILINISDSDPSDSENVSVAWDPNNCTLEPEDGRVLANQLNLDHRGHPQLVRNGPGKNIILDRNCVSYKA